MDERQSTFLEFLHQSHFKETPIANDGEEWADLFQINSSVKTSTSRLTTGCLPVFADDIVGVRHFFASVAAMTGATSATAVQEKKSAPTQSNNKKKRAKRSLAESQVYLKAPIETGAEITTTRSGRLSKRPQTIVVLDELPGPPQQ